MVKNVFSEKPIRCPACKKPIKLKYPNPKLYAASSRKEDQRVTGYTWVEGYQSDVLPHHYSVLQCPHCLYANFREKMERPGHDKKEQEVMLALKKLPEVRRAFLNHLRDLVPKIDGQTPDTPILDSRGAWAMHLSAIYQTLLPGKQPLIQHMKLGRLYLRLCWLYKEINGDTSTKESANDDNKKKSSAAKLYAVVEELDEKIQDILELLESATELAEKRTQELNLKPEDNPFKKLIEAVEDHAERSHQELSELEHIVQQDRSRILIVKGNGNGKENEAKVEEGPDFNTILQVLVAAWPQLPQTELNARKLAAEAFDYSFKHEEASQDIMQNLAVGNLLIQLLSDIGDMDRALEYSLQLYKACFKDKQSLTMNLAQLQKDESANANEVKELNRMLGLVTSTLASSGDSRKILLGRIYERDKEKISNVLNSHPASPINVIEQALITAGISTDMVVWLKERQVLKVDPKKKKWFGK